MPLPPVLQRSGSSPDFGRSDIRPRSYGGTYGETDCSAGILHGSKAPGPRGPDPAVEPVVAEQAGGQEGQERVRPGERARRPRGEPDRRPHREPREPPELPGEPVRARPLGPSGHSIGEV